jgi:hypothetical protein
MDVKRHRSMKSLSPDQQLGLASPLNYAAIQSGKTKTPLRREEKRAGAGCKPHRLPRGEGRECFLDILFHRMSEMAIYRQLTGNFRFADNLPSVSPPPSSDRMLTNTV